jgi:hypothetical protein
VTRLKHGYRFVARQLCAQIAPPDIKFAFNAFEKPMAV